jgi:hypothetical protein
MSFHDDFLEDAGEEPAIDRTPAMIALDLRIAGQAEFDARYCIRKGEYRAYTVNAEGKTSSSCTGPYAWSVSKWAISYAESGSRVIMLAGRA